MKVGKIPPNILKDYVFHNLKKDKKEIIKGPGIGEDSAAIQLEKDEVFLVSTDPITGADKDMGYLAVHVSCNDIASCGGEPIGVLLTILLPEGSTKEDLLSIMDDANKASNEINVEIIGGHTEITNAVNRPVISATAIGKVEKDKLVLTENAKIGQDLIMTKWAGLEGTTIIAKDCREELAKVFSEDFLNNAQDFTNFLSVVPEGRIGADFGATSMHDATEGGVLGAIWEIAESSGVGVEVYLDKIPVRKETIDICNYYNISPYKLISSGCMLIASYDGSNLVEKLRTNGIEANIIGKITKKDRVCIQNKRITPLRQPDVDELYKVIK
ncbi:MAG TPA: AIR synthase family protein [Defluviitaleaceae bacterium]|nr:AIR synthase family protein [Defluviitaleaceae bacterium]